MGNALSYCAMQVRGRDRNRFLRCLFVPELAREKLLAIYALNIELSQIRQAVSEEMLGHIRFAWWQEGLEAIASGQPPRAHPVLQAFTPELAGRALALVEEYRTRFPEWPTDNQLVDEIATETLQALSPQSESGWQKAGTIIDRHHQRFGHRARGWLALKLLISGL